MLAVWLFLVRQIGKHGTGVQCMMCTSMNLSLAFSFIKLQ